MRAKKIGEGPLMYWRYRNFDFKKFSYGWSTMGCEMRIEASSKKELMRKIDLLYGDV